MLATETYPLFMRVLEYIRQGYLPTTACRRATVSWGQFKRAMQNDPALKDMFEEALLECRDQMFEALVSINDPQPGQVYSESDPKMAAIISKNIMWTLEKMWPEKYMTKLTITHDNKADTAIIEALNQAIQRIPLPAPALQIAAPVIDVPYTVVEPERDIEAELRAVGCA